MKELNACVVTKERVVGELDKLVDKYFEEMSEKLVLDYGDVDPEQCLELDDAIKKIADVVVNWAAHNKETNDESGTDKT